MALSGGIEMKYLAKWVGKWIADVESLLAEKSIIINFLSAEFATNNYDTATNTKNF